MRKELNKYVLSSLYLFSTKQKTNNLFVKTVSIINIVTILTKINVQNEQIVIFPYSIDYGDNRLTVSPSKYYFEIFS